MNISQKIIESIKTLPESKQIEIFDFVEFLKQKSEKEKKEMDKVWSNLSVASAMRGMEAEKSPYSQTDLKETY